MMDEDDEANTNSIEQCVFEENNVFFYQIPRHASTSDPRAEHWNPESPLLTGSLKIIQYGDSCTIRLYEPPRDGNVLLFAQAPIDIDNERNLSIFVQDCADSSRYFVLRVEDEKTKRHAFIGIGFPERPVAFNFKACLQDYVRYRQHQLAASLHENKTHDYSLKQGQVIHVNITGSTNSSKEKKKASADKTVFKLAPPPSSSSSSSVDNKKQEEEEEEDDWGDFTTG